MVYTFNSFPTLAVTIVVHAALTLRCIISPNRNTSKDWKHDRLGFFATSTFTNAVGIGLIAIYVLHIALVCAWQFTPPPSLPYCPHPERLNSSLLTWNTFTVTSLLGTILLGAPLHISAYTGLGRNFTYKLTAPNKLTTDGIYQYMQHPSYTGLMIVLTSSFAMLLRWDGPIACWLPAIIYDRLDGWGTAAYTVVIFAFGHRMMTRIQDEEAMLKELFGVEWVDWHNRTARFIPLVY